MLAVLTLRKQSTTLSTIDVKIGNLDVIDTPGIVCEDSIINYLSLKDIKRINSKKEIKPITFQIKGKGSILLDELFSKFCLGK